MSTTCVESFQFAYYGYKIFEVTETCMGDVTLLGERLDELFGDIATEALIELENVTEFKNAVLTLAEEDKEINDRTIDFIAFSNAIIDEAQCESNRNGGQGMMSMAREVYESFIECDNDGNGVISLSEFIRFCAKFEISGVEALRQFEKADIDGNGEHQRLKRE